MNRCLSIGGFFVPRSLIGVNMGGDILTLTDCRYGIVVDADLRTSRLA